MERARLIKGNDDDDELNSFTYEFSTTNALGHILDIVGKPCMSRI